MKRLLMLVVVSGLLSGCDDSNLQEHISGNYSCFDDGITGTPTSFDFYIKQGARHAEYDGETMKADNVEQVGGGNIFSTNVLGYDGMMFNFHTEMTDADSDDFGNYLKYKNGVVNVQIYKKAFSQLLSSFLKGDFSRYLIWANVQHGQGRGFSGECKKIEID